MGPSVFVTRNIPRAGLELLEAECEVEVWPGALPPPRAELLAAAKGRDALLTLLSDTIDAELMDAAGPQLRVVSNMAVGFDNIDLAAAQARGIAVGNTPDVLTDATADLTMALLLAAARRLGEAQSFVRAGGWQTWDPLGHIGQDLKGKTLGIVGLGRIGAAVAQRCVGGWDMRLVYTGPRRKPRHAAQLGAVKVDLETLLEVSDFISVHCPLLPETHALFDAEAFRRMKRTAVFVNTSRGAIHDQGALEAALREQSIFAAGLDVTVPEPLEPPHPLLSLPNCIVLPHMGSATIQSRNGMARIAAHNCLAGLEGQELPHPVTLA